MMKTFLGLWKFFDSEQSTVSLPLSLSLSLPPCPWSHSSSSPSPYRPTSTQSIFHFRATHFYPFTLSSSSLPSLVPCPQTTQIKSLFYHFNFEGWRCCAFSFFFFGFWGLVQINSLSTNCLHRSFNLKKLSFFYNILLFNSRKYFVGPLIKIFGVLP